MKTQSFPFTAISVIEFDENHNLYINQVSINVIIEINTMNVNFLWVTFSNIQSLNKHN